MGRRSGGALHLVYFGRERGGVELRFRPAHQFQNREQRNDFRHRGGTDDHGSGSEGHFGYAFGIGLW